MKLAAERAQWHRDRIKDLEAGHTRGLTEADAAELLAHHRRELHLLEAAIREGLVR